MDAITLLRNDHKTVEQLFKRFEKAGDRAYVEKREIVDRIIEELSVHAAIEEQVFYPVARATVSDTEDIALESLEEHHIVKWLLSELDGMDPKHERFDAKVTVLMENVRHHVEEEQDEFFPKVRDELGRTALADLGQAMADAKKSAPTHPHPRAPDVPPGNSVVGAIAGVVDRVGDNISGIAQGGVTAVQDLIARVAAHRQAQGVADRFERCSQPGQEGPEGRLGRNRRCRADGPQRQVGRHQDRQDSGVGRQGHGDQCEEVRADHEVDRQAGRHDDRPDRQEGDQADHRNRQARRRRRLRPPPRALADDRIGTQIVDRDHRERAGVLPLDARGGSSSGARFLLDPPGVQDRLGVARRLRGSVEHQLGGGRNAQPSNAGAIGT